MNRQTLKPWFSDSSVHQIHLRACLDAGPHPEISAESLRFCISKELSGDSDAMSSRATLGGVLVQSTSTLDLKRGKKIVEYLLGART